MSFSLLSFRHCFVCSSIYDQVSLCHHLASVVRRKLNIYISCSEPTGPNWTKPKRTNNYLQNIAHKSKDRVTRTPLKWFFQPIYTMSIRHIWWKNTYKFVLLKPQNKIWLRWFFGGPLSKLCRQSIAALLYVIMSPQCNYSYNELCSSRRVWRYPKG